jgi:hypothetical protein
MDIDNNDHTIHLAVFGCHKVDGIMLDRRVGCQIDQKSPYVAKTSEIRTKMPLKSAQNANPELATMHPIILTA